MEIQEVHDSFQLLHWLTRQARMTETLRISRIHVPENVDESDFINGATEYLLNLPRTEVVNLSLDTFSEQWKYKYGELSLLGNDQV